MRDRAVPSQALLPPHLPADGGRFRIHATPPVHSQQAEPHHGHPVLSGAADQDGEGHPGIPAAARREGTGGGGGGDISLGFPDSAAVCGGAGVAVSV